MSSRQLFPPTRNYTEEDLAEALRQNEVDSILVISLTSDQSVTNYLGTVSNSFGTATTTANVNNFGNTATVNANTSYSGTTTSTPMYERKRMAFGDVALYDASNGAIAWRGQIKTSGSGMLSTTDGAFLASASGEIAAKLFASGLISPRSTNGQQ